MKELEMINPTYRVGDYYVPPHKKSSSQKDYRNKNSNIEYYTDSKGNIRKRRIK